jgi:zinc protease
MYGFLSAWKHLFDNRVQRIILVVFLFTAAFSFICPANIRGSEDQAAPAQDTGILRATLDNGLKVVIVRNTLAPVVTTIMNYLVGSDESPKGFPGMAHAQEHMMFRGSKELSAGQLANIIASMGGGFQADTRQHVTRYFFSVPSEDLETALRIESIRMRDVLNSEPLWKQERGAMEQEVAQNLSIPEYIFYTRLLAAMFKGTPYERDALGTKESLRKTTGAMLREFHRTWYVPNNAILVIVGNVRPEEALDKVKKLFGGIPARKLPARPQVRLQPVKPQTIRLKTDNPRGTIAAAFRTPGYDNPDYAAVKVLADVLNSRRGVLYALVPEGKALDTGFDLLSLPKAGLCLALAEFPRGADEKALQAEMKNILLDIKKNGVSPDLVKAAKRHATTVVELEKNSVTGLAMAWSRALAIEGRTSPEEEVEAMKKVSVEDVNRVARTYLDPDHSIIAVLTPEPSGKPISAKGFGGIESFAPEQIKKVKLPEWAEKSLKKLTVPASTLNPTVHFLPNGIKLIIQPVFVSNTVSVYGRVKNRPEMEVPAGKEGVDEVLDKLFSFGTESLDRIAFLKAVDDIGAFVSAGTDFSLMVSADQFEQGIRLLAENQLRPAFPEHALAIIRQQVAGAVADLLESPEYLSSRAVRRALYPGNDPTLRQAVPETVSALTLQDVKDYYRKVFRPDLTTIVVIGKVDPDRAKGIVEQYFGTWKAPDTPKPETLLPPVPDNKASRTAVPNSSRVQDRVILAQTIGITRSHPDYYPLQLGNHVLGGAFYATRLYRDLREQTGLVYFVSSSFEVNQTRGLYVVEYACDPPKVSRARSIVERNLEEMRTRPVSPEELLQAKALVLREIPLSESSVEYVARGFIRRTELELPLDEPTRAARRYVDLTAEQIRAAFSRWLRPGDLIQVTEGPPPR